MKRFFYISLLLGCIGCNIALAASPSTTSCTNWLQEHPGKFSFSNFYTGGITSESARTVSIKAQSRTCSFYRMGGSAHPGDIQATQIIPVYKPKGYTPVRHQLIYLGQDYSSFATGAHLFWGIDVALPDGDSERISPFFGFYAGSWDNVYQVLFARDSSQTGGGAYFRSLQEPFKSAPQVQMYSYLGKPLLVARSNTGLVTDVYFQGRDIPDPMDRAKKYLKEEWYHP